MTNFLLLAILISIVAFIVISNKKLNKVIEFIDAHGEMSGDLLRAIIDRLDSHD